MNVQQLELAEMWSETDSERGVRVELPDYARHRCLKHHRRLLRGAAGTSISGCTPTAPRKSSTSPPDRARRSSETSAAPVEAGSLALHPSMVPHDVVNTGDEPLRVVGFFSSATVLSTFEEAFAPLDANVLLSPPALAPAKLEAVPA